MVRYFVWELILATGCRKKGCVRGFRCRRICIRVSDRYCAVGFGALCGRGGRKYMYRNVQLLFNIVVNIVCTGCYIIKETS